MCCAFLQMAETQNVFNADHYAYENNFGYHNNPAYLFYYEKSLFDAKLPIYISRENCILSANKFWFSSRFKAYWQQFLVFTGVPWVLRGQC